MDFAQTRYFASSYGRFSTPDDFLNDVQPLKPQKWNLYIYVSNNPLRYVDPSGEIQENEDGTIKTKKRRANGTTEFKIGDKIYSRYDVIKKDGKSYALIGEVEPVYVFADDGTEIKATVGVGDLKLIEDKTYESQEALDKAEMKDFNGEGSTHSADCHGVTFAKGQVWINNDQVNKILKGDGYVQTTSPQVGDVGIYGKKVTDKGEVKGIQHSVTVSKKDGDRVAEVISKGGTNPVNRRASPGPGAGTAWDPGKKNIQLFYFSKRTK